MNRLTGIVVAVIGLIVTVLGAVGILPGWTGFGRSLIVLGGVLIGVTYIKKPDPEDAPRMSTPSTLVNIFFSPGDVLLNLRRHPRWLVAVLLMSLCWTVFGNLFLYRLTPETVANYAIDKAKDISFLPEEARREMEKGRPEAVRQNKEIVPRAMHAVTEFIWYGVVGTCLLSIVFFLFGVAMGGKINLWQSLAATAYAWFAFTAIRTVLNVIILFIKDPADIHPLLGMQGGLIQDNLGVLVKPGDSPALYTFLSSFALTSFYWIWLQATGLKNAGEKVSSASAWTATLVVWVIGILFPWRWLLRFLVS